MQITVNIALTAGDPENWTMSLNEVADAVLKAVGADESVDHCTVTMSIPGAGTAGVAPGSPTPFFVQQGDQLPPPENNDDQGPGGGKPK